MIGYGNSVFLRTAWEVSGGVPPVNTVAPVISGGTSLGSVLTSTTGTWTGTPTIAYTYQWKRGVSNIIGATSSTYTLVVADSGAAITCVVTATNSFGTANATSNVITAQTYTAPVNTVAPAITGTAQEGQIVTCSTGTWTGTPTITFAYQWKRNGSNIGSATNSTYTLVTADVSQSITCQVTATNPVGSANATSNTITPIAAVDPDAQAFITAAGITNPTQQGAINTLVLALKGYSIWTKFKAIYPIVGGTASSHAVNLKTPGTYNTSFATGVTHSSTGMVSNGTTGYADTFLNVNNILNLNSTHLSYYSRTNLNANQAEIGASGTGQTYLIYNFSSNRFITINSSFFSAPLLANTTGLLIENRRNATEQQSYKSGSLVNTATVASVQKPNLNVFLLCINSNGAASLISTKQCAFASIGDGLTDTEAANFYTAVQAYQTTLSRQV
jgi:hypothetical protein